MEVSTNMTAYIYTDASVRNKKAFIGYIAYDESDNIICKHSEYIGKGIDSTEAEISAAIQAIKEVSRKAGIDSILITTDSQAVVRSERDISKATSLPLEIRWLPREYNSIADGIVDACAIRHYNFRKNDKAAKQQAAKQKAARH